MYAALAEAFASFDRDDRIRVATIAGGDDFTAGNDLGDFIAASLRAAIFERFRCCAFSSACAISPSRWWQRCGATPSASARRCSCIATPSSPDVCAISSAVRATGSRARGGLVAAAAVDGRARSRVGAAPERRGARGGTSLAFGLVNLVKEDESAEIAAEGIASRIASLPPEAVRETKRLIRAPWADAVKKQMDEEAVAFAQRLASPEFAKPRGRCWLKHRRYATASR